MSNNVFKGTTSDNPGLAVVIILAALTFLSFQDGLVKLANAYTSLWQFQFLRACFNFVLTVGGLALAGQLAMIRPKNPVAVAARTLALMATMVFFFAGSPFLTLSEMGAGLYTFPIFTTILSVIFLGERVGPWRIGAVVVAALGAVLIIQPGAEGFRLAQLLPVGAGLGYAINAIILRRYCRLESPVTMAVWTAVGFMALSLAGAVLVSSLPMDAAARAGWPFLLEAWPKLTGLVLGLAAIAAICNVTGNILIVKAYQSAELSWLAPIDYTYLIFATLWGFILFADLPTISTILGMALIALAGITIAFRERKLGAGSRNAPNS